MESFLLHHHSCFNALREEHPAKYDSFKALGTVGELNNPEAVAGHKNIGREQAPIRQTPGGR